MCKLWGDMIKIYGIWCKQRSVIYYMSAFSDTEDAAM